MLAQRSTTEKQDTSSEQYPLPKKKLMLPQRRLITYTLSCLCPKTETQLAANRMVFLIVTKAV